MAESPPGTCGPMSTATWLSKANPRVGDLSVMWPMRRYSRASDGPSTIVGVSGIHRVLQFVPVQQRRDHGPGGHLLAVLMGIARRMEPGRER